MKKYLYRKYPNRHFLTVREFINEMRIAGYNDDEISDLIIRSRDRLEDDATSLDDFEGDFE